MRSCLSFLVFVALLVGAVAWFGAAPLASGLVGASIAAAGFQGDGTTVEVEAQPPLELLVGRADRVSIRSRSVASGTLHAESLTLTLTDVRLLDRSAASARGTLTGVTLRDATGEVVAIDRIDIDGPPDAADSQLTVAAAEVRRRALDGFGAAGFAVTDVTPDAPDSLLVTALGRQLRAGLVIDSGGAISLSVPGLAPIAVVAPPSGFGVRFTSVAVTAERSLLVGATIDLRPLLGG